EFDFDRLAHELHAAVVDDDLRNELRIRDDDHPPIVTAQHRIAHAYGFDLPFIRAHRDLIADLKRAVDEEHDARDQVRQHVFERKAKRETGQSETGDERRYVEAHFG